MDPTHITPFVASVQNVFSTMLQLPVTVGDPAIKADPNQSHDVTAIIGMSGDVVGSVALAFSSDTARRVVALFCGMEIEPDSPDFADAVGELANMVCGGAKAGFPDTSRVSISVPSVIVGAGHTIARQSDMPCVLIPCETDCGDITIEVAIRPAPQPVNDNTAAEASA
ncbi:MAG: chemotaxis protein CheX [Planctomycetota bacterium]